MSIKIEFDGQHSPRIPTIVLASRNGKKIGVLNTIDNISVKDSIDDACEISFDVYKYFDNEICNLWNDIKDFKLIWCKEWDKWFSIEVKITESKNTVKNIVGTDLGEFELSQIMLYNIEINTEDDIERDDYDENYPTILYNPDRPESSLLHRILSKAPHYSIAHVDENIAGIQRIFTFNNKSITDAFKDIEEEIGCMFTFSSNTGGNGEIIRSISVYDSNQTCLNCGFRGDFTDKCPKCGSTNFEYGYGEDTTIFVSTDCLTEEVVYETDIKSVKNAYKLKAGDDELTSTVRDCYITPGGYMYYFSPELREDMSDELRAKLDEYDLRINEYETSATIQHPESVSAYNTLVDKYISYNADLEYLPSPLVGFSNLTRGYYESIDFGIFLQSVLMPTPEIDSRTAADQVALLTPASLSPIALSELTNKTTVSNVEDAIRIMAGVYVYTSQFRIVVATSSWNNPTWRGTITLTSYADNEDTATTQTITLTVTSNYDAYTKQIVDRKIKSLDDSDYGLYSLFSLSESAFKNEIKKYCADSLSLFLQACQDVINILVDRGANVSTSDLYNSTYIPFTKKKQALEQEIDVRHNEIVQIIGETTIDEHGEETVTTPGLKQYISDVRTQARTEMNYENFLGNSLWLELCTYRREDEYSNENYTSDGLSNTKMVEKALEFLDRAREEIYKAATMQHTISATLNNLLIIDEFKPLVDYFELGNWIRVRIDDCVYRLRLTEYEIDFSNLSTINVTFTDATKVRSSIGDITKMISQEVFSSGSMDAVAKMAGEGNKASTILDAWLRYGLLAGEQLQLYNRDGSPLFNQGGQLIVSRGVDGSDLADLMQEVSPEDGEDAVVVRVDSTRGLVFKNDAVNTQLQVTIFYGAEEITNITSLRLFFGVESYLQWKWKPYNSNVWTNISNNDPRVSDNGFKLVISPNDVDGQAVFQCDLII